MAETADPALPDRTWAPHAAADLEIGATSFERCCRIRAGDAALLAAGAGAGEPSQTIAPNRAEKPGSNGPAATYARANVGVRPGQRGEPAAPGFLCRAAGGCGVPVRFSLSPWQATTFFSGIPVARARAASPHSREGRRRRETAWAGRGAGPDAEVARVRGRAPRSGCGCGDAGCASGGAAGQAMREGSQPDCTTFSRAPQKE